jgi:hypothetical protein
MRNQQLLQRGATECYSKAGLAEGTNAATIKTAAPNGAGTDYAINGLAYHHADTDNIAMNALAIQADLTTCLYLVQITSAGVVSLKKGVEVLTADLAAGNKVLHWPLPDANNCPIGAIKVATSATTFTSGTTDLSAAGVTATYYDFGGGMPDAPLTS